MSSKSFRAWLNANQDSTACMGWQVDGNHGNLEFRDCSRSVNLEFYTGNDKKKQAALLKLDKIIQALTKFRTELAK